MYPGTYAAEAPDRVAAVMAGTGETLSYGDLERRSVQLAHVLHEAGLRPGDVVALLTENNLRAFEVYWAAMRSGLYITAVNWHLKPDEIAYIVTSIGCPTSQPTAPATASSASDTVIDCAASAIGSARWGSRSPMTVWVLTDPCANAEDTITCCATDGTRCTVVETNGTPGAALCSRRNTTE